MIFKAGTGTSFDVFSGRQSCGRPIGGAFEDVFAGRVAVNGGPEGEAVGAIGAEKIKAGAEAVMEGCRRLNLERGIFRWDSENPLFFSLPHGEKAGGAAFSAGSRTAEFEP